MMLTWTCSACSSRLSRVIIACNHLPFFKIFSSFVHFSQSLNILPFFWKIALMPWLSRIGPDIFPGLGLGDLIAQFYFKPESFYFGSHHFRRKQKFKVGNYWLVCRHFKKLSLRNWEIPIIRKVPLTHSFPVHPFSIPWKHRDRERVHWERMG